MSKITRIEKRRFGRRAAAAALALAFLGLAPNPGQSQEIFQPGGIHARKLERGRISAKDLDRALTLQRESGTKIGKILVDMGFLTERDACLILCEQLHYEFSDPETWPDNVPDVLESVPLKYLMANHILPLSMDEENNVMTVVVEDPANRVTIEGLRQKLDCRLKLVMGTPSDIQDGLERYFGEGVSQLEKIVDDVDEFVLEPVPESHVEILPDRRTAVPACAA